MKMNKKNGMNAVIPAQEGIQFRLFLNVLNILHPKYSCELDPCLRRDDKQKGFAQLLIIAAVVLIIGLFVFLYFFFKQNNERLDSFVNGPDTPPGVVTDKDGQICDTQDSNYCHETPDVETWKDDGLP